MRNSVFMGTRSLEQKSWLRKYQWFLLMEGLLAALIFYVDLSMELGVAGGVLYVSIVLMALWARQKSYIWVAAVMGTILTVLGYWLSPPGGEFWKVALNRALSMLLIWGTAFFCYLFKLSEEGLQQANDQLEEQFNSLAKKEAELEFANKQLEQKVDERTQELRASNLYLEKEIKKNVLAKKELENTHLRLTTILNASAVGIYGLDMNGKTTFCNPSAAAMIGCSIDEIVGKNQHELIHHSRMDGSPYPVEDCYIYSALHLQASYMVRDEVFWRKDGTSFQVEYISTPLFEDGVQKGAVVTFKDISAQKHIEQERETLLTEMEQMNMELKNFAHVVSHDLKEPLRGIAFNSKWLVQDYGGILGNEGKEYLDRLIDNSERMSNLINGLLKFTEVGNIEELSVPVKTGPLVENIVKSLPLYEDIKVEIQPPMPEVIYSPVRLEQVFQNLIVNGVRHFGKKKGKVVVSCSDNGDLWQFVVWDNGQGIHPQHFDKIFEIFQSLAPKKSSDSTGIGLALVKKIVEQNGGEINVKSEVGKFSEFRFTVPKMV